MKIILTTTGAAIGYQLTDAAVPRGRPNTDEGRTLNRWVREGVPALRGVERDGVMTEDPVIVLPNDPFFMLYLTEAIESSGWHVRELDASQTLANKRDGTPCGDSFISADKECHVGEGTARRATPRMGDNWLPSVGDMVLDSSGSQLAVLEVHDESDENDSKVNPDSVVKAKIIATGKTVYVPLGSLSSMKAAGKDFAVGDKVLIQTGKAQGTEATVTKVLPSGKVKVVFPGSGKEYTYKNIHSITKVKPKEAKAPAAAPAPEAKTPAKATPSDNLTSWDKSMDISDLGPKIGKKLGTQEGGVYDTKQHGKAYVKFMDPNTATVELLAADLYKAAGANVVDYFGLFDGPDNLHGVGSKWQDTIKTFWDSPTAKLSASEDFAIHAWLNNRDAIGAGSENPMDNIRVDPKTGAQVIVDVGGSLDQKGMGGTKTFAEDASEWESMRSDKNPTMQKVFASGDPIAERALILSAHKLEKVTDKMIDDAITNADDLGALGGKAEYYSQTLKARRDNIISKAKAEAAAKNIDWESGEYKDFAAKPDASGPPDIAAEALKAHVSELAEQAESIKLIADALKKNAPTMTDFAFKTASDILTKKITELGTKMATVNKAKENHSQSQAAKKAETEKAKPAPKAEEPKPAPKAAEAEPKPIDEGLDKTGVHIAPNTPTEEQTVEELPMTPAHNAEEWTYGPSIKKLDILMAFATQGDLKGLQAYELPKVGTHYPKLKKYQDNLIKYFKDNPDMVGKIHNPGPAAVIIENVKAKGGKAAAKALMETEGGKQAVKVKKADPTIPVTAGTLAKGFNKAIAKKLSLDEITITKDELPQTPQFATSNEANKKANEAQIEEINKKGLAKDLDWLKKVTSPSPKVMSHAATIVGIIESKMSPGTDIGHDDLATIEKLSIPPKSLKNAEKILAYVVTSNPGQNPDLKWDASKVPLYAIPKNGSDPVAVQAKEAYNKMNYSAKQVAQNYKGSASTVQNQMRFKNVADPSIRNFAEQIMEHSFPLPEGKRIRRMLHLTQDQVKVMMTSVGKVLQDPGPQGTGASYGDGFNVRMNYLTTKGSKGMYIEYGWSSGSEKELLLPPNQRFYVSQYRYNGAEGKHEFDCILLPTVDEQCCDQFPEP